MNQAQKDILTILFNRQKSGISIPELMNIMNTPELLEKEKKLFGIKLRNLNNE
jgi:hypothetical protein